MALSLFRGVGVTCGSPVHRSFRTDDGFRVIEHNLRQDVMERGKTHDHDFRGGLAEAILHWSTLSD